MTNNSTVRNSAQPSREEKQMQVAVTQGISETPAFDGYPELMTVEQIAEASGMCARQVRYQCAKGKLPAVHIGRRWYVSKTKLAQMFGVANG